MDVRGQEAEYYFYHKSDWSVQTSWPCWTCWILPLMDNIIPPINSPKVLFLAFAVSLVLKNCPQDLLSHCPIHILMAFLPLLNSWYRNICHFVCRILYPQTLNVFPYFLQPFYEIIFEIVNQLFYFVISRVKLANFRCNKIRQLMLSIIQAIIQFNIVHRVHWP